MTCQNRRKTIMVPMFVTLFIETDADDLLTEEQDRKRREVDTQRTSRVHRPDAHLRRTAPSIGPGRVRRAVTTGTGRTSPASNDHPTMAAWPTFRWTCRSSGGKCSAA